LGIVAFRRGPHRRLTILAAAALAGFWLFSTFFKWQIFGSRYHLVFFMLLAPVVGGAYESSKRPWIARAIALGLVLLSVPWLLSIRSRPLVPVPGDSRVASVLIETRPQLLLANGLYLLRPYQEMADLIQEASCQDVGLALLGNSAEYPLWVFLGFPRTSRHIEWIVARTPSARLLAPDFEPCAVVCEGCDNDRAFRGLPPVYARDGFVLFLGEPSAEN